MSVEDIVEEGYGDEDFLVQNHPTIIRESALRHFFRCPRSFLLYKQGMKQAPLSTFVAQAIYFSKKRRDLFNLNPHILVQQYCAAGKLAEQMTREELQQHLAFPSAQAFGIKVKNGWRYGVVSSDTYIGRPLRWTFSGQDFKAGNDLERAAQHYYNFILEHGAPVFGLTDYEHIFDFEGTRFAVRFPEIRKGMILDNIHLWGFNLDISAYEKIETNPFVTLRILAFSKALHDYRIFRRKCGVSDEDAESWGEHIDTRITFRHFNTLKNEISETVRTDEHLDTLRRLIETFQEKCEREDFAPAYSHCSECAYSALDMTGKPLCPEMKKGNKSSVPRSYLLKKNYTLVVSQTDAGITLSGVIREEGKAPKQVNELVLQYSLVQTAQLALKYPLAVRSTYSSFAYGWGFEETILREAHTQLHALAKQLGREIVHTLDFSDFNHAGKQSIDALLKRFGYTEYRKTYKP